MKRSIRGLPVLALLTACAPVEPKGPGLPDPAPVFKTGEIGRADPVFSAVEFPEKDSEMAGRPIYQVGHMMVTTRLAENRQMKDQAMAVKVYAADKELCSFMWWGSLKDRGCGWPFQPIAGDPDDLQMDPKTGVTTYTKPYLNSDGQRSVFTYRLKPVGNSRVELTWEAGSTNSVSLWATFGTRYRGKRITIGGKDFIESSFEDLQNKTATFQTFSGGDLVYDVTDPLNGFTVELGGLSGGISEGVSVHDKGQVKRFGFSYRTTDRRENLKGRVVIDLGEVELADSARPPPVSGIDFWKSDATHVPVSPTRNVMHNPSFEQGLRGWYWIGGGAQYTPTNVPKYEIANEGVAGPSALRMNRVQMASPGLRSMPLALEKDKRYVVSFYAKAFLEKKTGIRLSFGNAARGGTLSGMPWGDLDNKASQFFVTDAWQRYHRTFTADAAGVALHLSGSGVLVDGLQVELGETPTEFVCDPLDVNFVTASPDNDLRPGDSMDAALVVAGKDGTQGKVELEIRNAFRELLFEREVDVSIVSNGVTRLPLNLSTAQFGTGVFVAKATITADGFQPYTDYYRFAIMAPLSNTHKTSRLMATLVGDAWRISRGEDLARKLMEWGWGGTSWMGIHDMIQTNSCAVDLVRRHRIVNAQTTILDQLWRGRDPKDTPWAKTHRDFYDVPEITPEFVKYVEEKSYEILRQVPKDMLPYTAYGNEEESSKYPAGGMFDKYFKLQSAVGRAARRAGIGCTPTSGTSGYNLLRGFEPYEGYLKAAHDAGFTYDALAVHPYGSIDKGSLSTTDLDDEAARLIAQGRRYGYGDETPILFTELFNIPETVVPEWGAGPSYDAYPSGKPTYDFGNREFVQAASAMRLYIICMKYWPRIQVANIWCSRPYMDLHLTPILLCKAVNTLGHLMGDVAYTEDIRPAAGIRGYAFKLPAGTGIAPIWCTSADVENGLKRCPILAVKFDQPVAFTDFMGNHRYAQPDKQGYTRMPVTPAPLFVTAKDVSKLAKALQNAEPDDSASSLAVSFRPTADGCILASLKNLTGRVQKGVLEVCGQKIPYDIKGNGEATRAIPAAGNGAAANVMHRWNVAYRLVPETGEPIASEWRMDVFFVTKTEGMPKWEMLPMIAVTNRCFKGEPKVVKPGDHDATYKMAWDAHNLYLRVEVADDKVLADPDFWKRPDAETMLWNIDGALEVYLDTGANGRSNGAKTFDNDDYRYDFSPTQDGQDGAGRVWRFREVYHQLADGVNMATKEEASKKVTCQYERTKTGYAMTVTFAQRYLEPIMLKPGFVAGCGLYLHDHDASEWKASKGLSTATEAGRPCDGHPELWPLMVLQ
jgi:hypothetical protein